MLQPKYTMDGWDVNLNMGDTARLQQRVLRTLLTSNLSAIAAPVRERFVKSLEEELGKCDGEH